MNQEDYGSDSDQSDDDFCPEVEAGGAVESDVVSEEDSEAEVSGVEETNFDFADIPKKKKRGRQTLTTTKKRSKSLESVDLDELTEQENCKRTTRQTDNSNCNGKGTIEKDELESDEEDKSRTDALWADFLNDVKPTISTGEVNKTCSSTLPKSTTNGKAGAKVPEKPGTESSEQKSVQKAITITEVMDFAGEEVRVQKVVNADSIKGNKDNSNSVVTSSKLVASPASLKRSMAASSGLSSILNQIGKKKKISVLDKTKLDWNSFKQNEGIEEDLQTHNKGKDGYLERQDFLQRTDVRQFEIEKSLRQSRRNN